MTLLARLLAATPPPPDGDDVDHLLAVAAVMTTARASLLDAAAPQPIATPAEAQQLAELDARQRAWHDLLMAARQRLAQQRLGATRVRAYAKTLAAGCR